MDFLPDWAPNVHPLLVHFPIALLCTAVLLDGIALLLRDRLGDGLGLRAGAVVVFVLGAVGALASFFTGRNAADALMLSAEADPILTEHADWALRTVWFFGLYALVRLGVLVFDREARRAVWIPLFLVGAGGLWLLVETAEHGAQLVFQHGVGVQAVAALEAEAQARQTEIDRSRAAAAGPVVDEDGSWRWTPGVYAAEGFAEAVTWLAGDAATLTPEAMPDAIQGHALALHAAGTPAFFVFDPPLRSLQADVTLNLDAFDGVLRIVHHALDAEHYGFLEIDGGTMRQGRVQNGQVEVLDEGMVSGAGWRSFRLVADRTHFRGYADGKLVTHGHGPAAEPGPVGLRLDGTGVVLVGSIAVRALR